MTGNGGMKVNTDITDLMDGRIAGDSRDVVAALKINQKLYSKIVKT